MLPRRVPAARALLQTTRSSAPRTRSSQLRAASTFSNDPSVTDPGMNGGYVNPPPGKRILRDPYGDWWDKQERRNFGEPVHEDNDLHAVFSTDVYRHATPGKAAFHFSFFILAVLGLCGAVYQVYPDKPSAPKTYASGLDRELGGEGSLPARKEGEDTL